MSTAEAPLLAFACPRCGEPVEEPFYGPCSGCAGELRQVAPPRPDPGYAGTRLERLDDAWDAVWLAPAP